MARQTKAQKIAEAVKSLVINYSIYSDSLRPEGEGWEYKRQWVFEAQSKLEELLGQKVEVLKHNELIDEIA